MEQIVLWQQKWGLSFHIPWYLFLGGLAGGTMTIAGVADLLAGRRESFRSFARMAGYLTVPAILLGGLSLSFHLGKPERGFAFPLFFTNYQSWMTIGGWILGVFAPLSVAYAAAWHFNLGRRLRLVLAALGIPLGLLMSLYTGWLLSATWLVPGGRWFVPFWDGNYLPVLFLLSGFSTGFAACGLAGLLSGSPDRTRAGTASEGIWSGAEFASQADVVTVLAEGAWVYLFLASLAVGTLGQQLAFRFVTRGDLAPWFWWGFVGPALAAPLLASVLYAIGERLLHVRIRWILYAKFLLVLVGGLLLRYVVVWGGDLKGPLVFPPSLWPVPGPGVSALPGIGG
ncbi:MAG: polysulfide reductase NrfD [Candidatus Rokubacteria bacterium]|nr:polysulfide reductase NrfD [Candidatus Rokubacteria bacterium]